MSNWIIIQDQADWEAYKAGLEKIPHSPSPARFPCLVWSRYDCSGGGWEHTYVYQEDAEMLFGAE